MSSDAPLCSSQQYHFETPSSQPTLLKSRSGHQAPPNLIRYYGEDGKSILTAGRDRALRLTSVVRDSRSAELSQGESSRLVLSSFFLSFPSSPVVFGSRADCPSHLTSRSLIAQVPSPRNPPPSPSLSPPSNSLPSKPSPGLPLEPKTGTTSLPSTLLLPQLELELPEPILLDPGQGRTRSSGSGLSELETAEDASRLFVCRLVGTSDWLEGRKARLRCGTCRVVWRGSRSWFLRLRLGRRGSEEGV